MGVVDKIELLCKQKKTNITALERELGFGRGSIRKWSTNSPSVEKAKKVASYFGISVDYLLDHEAPTEQDEIIQLLQDAKDRPEIRALFSVTKNATKEDIEQTIKIIKALRQDYRE